MKTTEIKLPFKLKNSVLALGPQAKNTVCFAKNDRAWVSPVHKDLSAPKDLSAFERDAEYFLKKNPEIIACDLHPEYQSTKLAASLAVKHTITQIQHHHAHVVSCMADNGLKNQKVIGVAFDGTGLGVDNTIWGAEFLLCDYKKFTRRAHLKEIPLVGGERAILEPKRAACAWLGFDRSIDKKQTFKKIFLSGINSPLASSMGRLFDAAASLVLRKDKASFEAELAIKLEQLAKQGKFKTPDYKFNIIKSKAGYILDPSKILWRIIRDLKARKQPGDIARGFHQGVADIITRTCALLRKEDRVNKIVLSGGVFQNKLLLKMSSGYLSKEGFQVFTHRHLSCNDSGVSLGQAVAAGYRS